MVAQALWGQLVNIVVLLFDAGAMAIAQIERRL